MSQLLAEVESGADFSPCRQYRYALWRRWDDGPALAAYVLNPSDANETDNDMTIAKIIGFAKRWHFSAIYMLNPFALVSTLPLGLLAVADPIGPGNDAAIVKYSGLAEYHLAAWGSISAKLRVKLDWRHRIAQVQSLIERPLYCLGRTSDGSPRHPSRIAYDTQRELFSP